MVEGINPTGSATNCVNCALALDSTLAGSPEIAEPSGLTSVSLSGFTPASIESIEQQLLDAGPGAKGIVLGTNGEVGHAFNAVNYNGVVYFLDGQAGGAADTSFNTLYFFQK